MKADGGGLEQSIAEVRERIRRAAQRSGRQEQEITLVAVSKTVDLETISRAAQLGITHFGENRVQEFLPKYKELPHLQWHFIGHLQTNKVKDVIGKACLIHSLDRWRLAEYIDGKAKLLGLAEVDVLLEVNVSGERSKYGLLPSDVPAFLDAVERLERVRVRGLMTVAPQVDDPELARPVFKKLHSIFEDIKKRQYRNTEMLYLSMGMTQDFEVAVEEGSNMVRVGTAIFGARR
ncbi:MAG: YggS family pyridoxal phosphate-dependent enzyme [Syntrophothermus sp.]|uniref:YggS family pyridoxal phosphate-dependent enzyme n=1 Tax=Syntrophothermus sp. TaxID=2736299 RepID=UPI00257B4D45|nr:YggS family pyridoxal phosphate-dependent enzyme [Syntrophothermus sp.]NSW82282.1 YggS family pyridoxal phosphate-dependent enzyme [Syntrophothermus sp.]